MKLTNKQIYQYYNNIIDNLLNIDIYIPAKANFYLQKNIETILAAGQEIEKLRIKIGKEYGELDKENSQYTISSDNIEQATQELNELFSIEQNIDIKTFSINLFGNIEFTPNQMQSLMFMLED